MGGSIQSRRLTWTFRVLRGPERCKNVALTLDQSMIPDHGDPDRWSGRTKRRRKSSEAEERLRRTLVDIEQRLVQANDRAERLKRALLVVASSEYETSAAFFNAGTSIAFLQNCELNVRSSVVFGERAYAVACTTAQRSDPPDAASPQLG